MKIEIYVLNKYTISLFSENVVSSNIEMSQVRPVPVSPNIFLNEKSQVEPVIIWCDYLQRKFASEDSYVFLCLSLAAECRCGANFDEMNENGYKTKFRVLITK